MRSVTSQRRREGLETAAVVVGFIALTLVMTFPLVTHLTRALPDDLGDPLLNAWILGWDAQRFAHGLAGFWNAPILYPSPHTLAYSEHLVGAAIFVAPIYWLSANAILAYNVAFIGAYILAGTGMYLLARFLCGRRDAALLAALIFAFGPYRAGHLSHLQVLLSGWMPIALWLLHRYFAAPSWGRVVAFAAAFVLQALSNGYFLFFLALPVAIVSVVELARRRNDRTSLLVQLAIGVVLILTAIAPFAIMYVELRRGGFHRGIGDWINFSADVGSYLFVAGSVRFWGWLHGAPSSEAQLFPGLTALVLAAIAFLPSNRGASGSEFPTGSPEPRAQSIEPRVQNLEPRAQNPELGALNPAPRVQRGQIVRLYAVIAAAGFVLSLGPEPRAWGHRVLPIGPYLWLARIVPGLDGLRAPARVSILVYLALAVLAAFGATRVLGALSARLQRAAVLAIAAFALVEGAPLPLPMAAVDAKGRPQDRAAYRWLAHSESGAALELPIRDWDIKPTLIYQYATLFHGHPIANGYSGSGSLLQEFLGGPASPLGDLASIDATLNMLRDIGFRYVLVHPGDYEDPAFGAATARAIKDSSGHVAEARDYGAVTLFRLLPPAANRAVAALAPRNTMRRIGPGHFTVTASNGADRLPFAFDGNLDSRWTTQAQQTGSEWIAIQFDHPYDVGCVGLRMNRWSLGDYPRVLSVEAMASDGTIRQVYHADVLRLLGLGIVRDRGYPSIDIAMPEIPTTRVRLRQLGHTRSWFWSINEIELWERR